MSGLAASLSQEVAFVVMVSGYAGPLWDQDTYRMTLMMHLKSLPDEEIKLYKKTRDRLKKILRTGKGYDEFESELKKTGL